MDPVGEGEWNPQLGEGKLLNEWAVFGESILGAPIAGHLMVKLYGVV